MKVVSANLRERREVREANRDVCDRELPDCGKHGPQGRLSPMGTPAADRRLITVRTSDPNLSHVERGISRDFAARQTECDERILRQDGRHDLFSATAKGPAPCSFTPGELSKGRGKVASVSYRLSSRRSSEITLRVMIEYSGDQERPCASAQ